MKRSGKAYVGTSGWVYPEWRGKFYPTEVKDRDRLSYYASQFSTVEINTSFYHLPRADYVARWAETVPDGFKLCFKIWRAISQATSLGENITAHIDDFIAALTPAKAKCGPLLLQLPPRATISRSDWLVGLLGYFHKHHKGWDVAVEFRHDSWYVPETDKLLDRHKAALVLHDMPGSAWDKPNAGSNFVYQRYHGTTGKYRGSYDLTRLKADAGRLRPELEARDVYAFFNNDIGANAPRDAAHLKALLADEAHG